MLNILRITSLAAIVAIMFGCNKGRIIELPLSEIPGYGPFIASYGGISAYRENENNPWAKTYLNVSGIPKDWTDVKVGDIETNMYQNVYQNVVSGNISLEWYDNVRKSWNWIPDTVNLSKEPVKTKIAFAYGTDQSGNLKMLVDANNNLDFSDDPIFIPSDQMGGSRLIDRDSIALSNSIMVTIERLSNNRIVEAQVPLNITRMGQNDFFMCNFPQYAIAQLDGEEVAVCSDNFTSLYYYNTSILLLDESTDSDALANREKMVLNNEYLVVKDKVFKNLGVNWNKNVLMLEEITKPIDQLYSTQVGFKAMPFEGEEYLNHINISSEALKGKYVLLDFWAVWCSPCIAEFPILKEIYDSTDKSKFEIIGIVGDSPGEAVGKLIEEKSISWPQILSDSLNKIKENYNVNGYPTTFLIDPEGKIIAKNLRGSELKEKISEMIN